MLNKSIRHALWASLPLALALGGCKQEVAFTRVPAATTVEQSVRASDTAVFVNVPLNLVATQEAAERALPEQVARVLDWLSDAACDRRGGNGVQCMDGRVEGSITRSGPIAISADGGRLTLAVPLHYEIAMRGIGWAAYLRDRKTGDVTVRVPFEATLAAGYKLEVRPAGDIAWSERTVGLLKGKLQLPKYADAKLRAAFKDIGETLRQTLEGQSMREAVAHGWRGLHAPIQLAAAPPLWLRGSPEKISSGGFSVDGDQPVYRVAISTKLTVHSGERPAPLFMKPMPEPARALAAPLKTIVRLPFDISALPMQRAIAVAFPEHDEIDTQADAKAMPVTVRTARTAVYPARDRVALELQLDVVSPKRLFGMTGKAYFMGRPVLKPETGSLELEDIGFPEPPPKEAKNARQQILRIGEEPFAGRFAAAARMNIGREIAEFLPRLNAMVDQQLDETLRLQGTFEKAEVVAVEPIRDAFRLHLDLTGELSLRPGRPRLNGVRVEAAGAALPVSLPR